MCILGPVGRLLFGNTLPRHKISPHDMSQMATTNRQAIAWLVWSMASPATSGPTKFVAAPIMLKLLKLRMCSDGPLSMPTRFWAFTCRIDRASPLMAAAT